MNSCPIMARKSIRKHLVAISTALAPLTLLVATAAHSADCTPYRKYFHWTGSMVDPVHGEIVATTPAVSGSLAAGVTVHANRVVLYDVSDPEDIRFQGFVDPGSHPFAVAIENELLAVWIREWIQIYDVSSPRTPVLRSQVPYKEKVLCCSGTLDLINGLLYTTGRAIYSNFDPIAIFDLTNPSAPVLLTELQVPAEDHGLVVAGDFAYVASGGRGIGIVDLHTRSEPTFLGFLQSVRVESAWDVALVSGYLVVVERFQNWALVVYDLSNPQEPREVDRVNGSRDGYGNLSISGSNDRLLVQTNRPEDPPQAGLYRVDSQGKLLFDHEFPLGFAPDQLALLVGNTIFSGSVLAPADRIEPAPFAAQLRKRAWDLKARGDIAFCLTFLSGGGDGVAAYSFENPRMPKLVGEVETRAGVGLAMAGDRLFVHSQDQLYSIDSSDPSHMRVVSHLDLSNDPLFFLDGVAANERMVCLTSTMYSVHGDVPGALHFLAWGPETKPHEVGRLEGIWSGDAVFLDNTTLVAALEEHPALIDLSDPSKPQVVDVHPELTRTTALAANGPIVYAARYQATAILERTAKAKLDVVGHIGGSFSHSNMAISGNVAAVPALGILDVSDPRNPRQVGSVHFPELEFAGIFAVAITDHAIVVGNSMRGLGSALLPCAPRPRFEQTVLLDDDDHREGEPRDSQSASATGESLALQLEPNPFTTSLQLSLQAPIHAKLEIAIYDVAGRVVRTMPSNMGSASSRTMTWDGKDSGGRDVSAGVYLVRLQSESSSVMRRVVKVR